MISNTNFSAPSKGIHAVHVQICNGTSLNWTFMRSFATVQAPLPAVNIINICQLFSSLSKVQMCTFCPDTDVFPAALFSLFNCQPPHLLPLLLQPGIFSPGEYPMRPPFPLGLDGTDARRPKGKNFPIKL